MTGGSERAGGAGYTVSVAYEGVTFIITNTSGVPDKPQNDPDDPPDDPPPEDPDQPPGTPPGDPDIPIDDPDVPLGFMDPRRISRSLPALPMTGTLRTRMSPWRNCPRRDSCGGLCPCWP